MRVFVAGATGVLGRALVPLLLEGGHTVRALVRSAEKAAQVAAHGVEIVEGDILSPGIPGEFLGMMDGCNAAVHIATAIPSDFSKPGAWDHTARLRTEGTRLMLDAALAAGVRRYVQQSIVMAYRSGGDALIDESWPLDDSARRAEVCAPVIEMERMVRQTGPGDIEWVILRGGQFCGPGTAQDKVIARLVAGEQRVACDGSSWISPVHVADMASAVKAAIERAPAASTYNIVDEPIRQGSYYDRLAELAGAPAPPRDASLTCPPSFRCSNRAAREALQWEPVHGIWPARLTPSK